MASDIDTQVLDTARRGVYAADSRGLAPERLRRHFLRGTGANAGFIRVRPELARLVEFRAFNLMSTSWSGLGEAFDLVFCRNVMIYFDNPTQRQVLERMHGVLQARAACSMSVTPRTSPTRATCSGCAARPSTSGSEPA